MAVKKFYIWSCSVLTDLVLAAVFQESTVGWSMRALSGPARTTCFPGTRLKLTVVVYSTSGGPNVKKNVVEKDLAGETAQMHQTKRKKKKTHGCTHPTPATTHCNSAWQLPPAATRMGDADSH